MSLTVFLAFCIPSCDFLLYVLLQWIYGVKHRNHTSRATARREKRRTLSVQQVENLRAAHLRLDRALPFIVGRRVLARGDSRRRSPKEHGLRLECQSGEEMWNGESKFSTNCNIAPWRTLINNLCKFPVRLLQRRSQEVSKPGFPF